MPSPSNSLSEPSEACFKAIDELEIVPWEGQQNHLHLAQLIQSLSTPLNRPLLVAIGGPGGTGKSTLTKLLQKHLTSSSIVHLDDYKTPRAERAALGIFGAHPQANKMNLIQEHLIQLRLGNRIEKPVYNAIDGTADHVESVSAEPIVLLDGEISTYAPFRSSIDLSVFIDAHWRTQLQTRLERDIKVRNYTPEKAIATFLESNLREFPKYGADSQHWSHIRLWADEHYQLKLVALEASLAATLKAMS
jgi:phosphoribulokinase